MRMSILRAVNIDADMEVDLDVTTEVVNIDLDSHEPDQVTLYGTEEGGELYYIVLDVEVLDRINEVRKEAVMS